MMSFDSIILSMRLVILTLGVLVNPSICKDNPRMIFVGLFATTNHFRF